MPTSIKTREVVKDIKIKNNEGNLKHFLKSSTIIQKPQDINTKENAEMTSEASAINNIQTAGLKATYGANHRIKEYGKQKIIKANEERKLNKLKSIEYNSIKTSNPTKKVSPNFKEKTYNKQMRHLSMHKYKKQTSEAKTTTQKIKQITVTSIQKGALVIKRTASALSTLTNLGIGLIIIVVLTLFIGVFGALSSDSVILPGTANVSEEVLAYTPIIEKYAKEYDMEDYIALIQAVMMQESSGVGKDPMQSSESDFNEKFPRVPNGITEPEYSIEVGIKTLSNCFEQANVKDPTDTEHIYLALQGYNYGNGYISWAIHNFGGYSKANAKLFSDMKKQELKTSVYGDPNYVEHVMRYIGFGFGNIRSEPNFENMKAWGFNNPYSASHLFGQCTWFAWGRFYEIYGYSPGFTGNGWDCAKQLVNCHPDKFELSSTPKTGAIFSGIGKNHVGIVINFDGKTITVQEGNLDGKTNTFQEAKKDWITQTYTLNSLRLTYGGVIFANPK